MTGPNYHPFQLTLNGNDINSSIKHQRFVHQMYKKKKKIYLLPRGDTSHQQRSAESGNYIPWAFMFFVCFMSSFLSSWWFLVAFTFLQRHISHSAVWSLTWWSCESLSSSGCWFYFVVFHCLPPGDDPIQRWGGNAVCISMPRSKMDLQQNRWLNLDHKMLHSAIAHAHNHGHRTIEEELCSSND